MVMIGGSHLLNALGINSNLLFKRLERVEQQVRDLQDLADSFGAAAGFMGPGALAQMLQSGGIPSATHMHGPPWGGCMCPGSYAMPRTFDFGSTGANPFSLRGLMDRQRGMMFERMLTQNPFARAQAEMMLGGRILPDGLADGRMTIQPFAPGFFPAGGAGNLAAAHAMNALNQLGMMNPAAAAAGGSMGGFNNMIMGALQNLLGQMMGSGQNGNAGNATNPAFANGNNPFLPNGTIPAADTGEVPGKSKYADAAGTDGDGNIAAVLADGSLTVEDQVALMLMMIMKQMDKQIKAQADKVHKLHQKAQQAAANPQAGGADDGAPSIDVETMKLKRMIDKRSQMFDMLRQIIDKYNQTAKNMIDSIGR
ncbi:MAG: hypothetical protein AAFZ18_25620 [Myxococcota bacterium]